jgi:release factor glutamine methyltransferase
MTSPTRRTALSPPPQAREAGRGSAAASPASGNTVSTLLPTLTDRLAAALDLERREARLEAQILMAHSLGVERAWLVAHDRDALSEPQANAIEALVRRREGGEPVAYILGEREFHGRLFKVSPDVLIPRPDTELLVEAALARLPADRPARVLDLGTGSGCVAVTLALERPRAQVLAVDVSPAALSVARENARRLGAANVACVLSDWYAAVGVKKFDMIVSNPPYVAVADAHLAQGDLRFEPRHALSSGEDGLDAIRLIVAGARPHLAPGCWLLFEHGWKQGPACLALLAGSGMEETQTWRDLSGIERVSAGRQPTP